MNEKYNTVYISCIT